MTLLVSNAGDAGGAGKLIATRQDISVE